MINCRLTIDGIDNIRELIASFNPSLFETILIGLNILSILTALINQRLFESLNIVNKSTPDRKTITKSIVYVKTNKIHQNTEYIFSLS